ncbi:MAG: hypothetical protein CL402_03195 [Acidiferrobacteraceae bacterium]|nr:hypothetical protein [Acidiferrobacteraceae bacterium]|tara:strand:- start:13653 stop:15077 length:1425 start_codon:yes stop_codon:yes gene_type:complete
MNRLFLLLALLLPLSALSDDFGDAASAYATANYKKAYELWKPLADQGDGASMFNLGALYWDGKGVIQNRSLAIRWWEKAKTQNIMAAQYNLGLAYYLGVEVDKDLNKAIALFQLAANQGHDFATSFLPRLERELLSQEKISSRKVSFGYSGADVGKTLADLYAGPSIENIIIDKLEMGSPIRVLETKSGWSRIEVPNEIKFWVYSEYVSLDAGSYKTIRPAVRVRTKPSTDKSSTIVGILPVNSLIEVEGIQDEWSQILKPELISIWIPARHVRLTSETDESWNEKWSALSQLHTTQSVTQKRSEPEMLERLSQPTNSDVSETTENQIKSVRDNIQQPNNLSSSATVSANFTEIFDGPTDKGQLLTLLAKNKTVQIVEKTDDWARVEVPTGLYVWVYGDYLTETDGRWLINTDSVRARSQPSIDPNSKVLGVFPKDSEVFFISRQGEWKRIKSADHVSGWVRLDQIKILQIADQ